MTDWPQRVARQNLFPDFDGDPDQLIRALTDVERRIWAARWLGELGEVQAVSHLLRLTQAADPHARTAAARALGDIGAKEALSRLVEMTQDDPDPVTQSWAAAALGQIGSSEHLPVLEKLLLSQHRVVRQGAVYALGLIGDSAALPGLRRARRRDRREWSYVVLGRHVYRQAIRRLKHGDSAPRA